MKKTNIILIILLLLYTRTFSQIEGDVRSNDNKRISGAVIVAMDTAYNMLDSVVSEEDGFYSFNKLKPGKYFIQAKAPGFQTRLYKNVIARENLVPPGKGDDKSSATRLQIVLTPLKTQKQ